MASNRGGIENDRRDAAGCTALVCGPQLRELGLWAALSLLAPGLLHWSCRWLRLSAERMDAINYGGILLFKFAIFLFNLVSYISLRIVA
jgi:hypothetical protein